jgi:YbbR domain-containing protein
MTPSSTPRWRQLLDWDNVRRWLRGLVFENLGFKLLSVIFAIATWSWVQGEQDVQQRARVTVDWRLPTNLALADEIPESLILTVKGSQMFVRNLDRAPLRMRVDLSDVSAGPQVVDFTEGSIENLPQNVHVVSISPARAEFRLDEKVKRRIRVTPVTIGEPGSGYRVQKISVEPDFLEVEGPRTRLAELGEIPTTPIDVGNLQDDKEENIQIAQIPSYFKVSGSRSTLVRIDIEPLTTVKVFEDVPVILRARGWTLQDDRTTLALQGPVADLEAIKHDEILVLVNVDEDAPHKAHRVTSNEGPVRYEIIFPRSQGVKVRSLRPDTFRIQPAE